MLDRRLQKRNLSNAPNLLIHRFHATHSDSKRRLQAMESRLQRKTMLSGIQPTGVPHLGNYIGAIRNWAALQHEYDYFLFIADLHSLTIPQNPKELRDNVYKLVAYLIAAGIDPKQSTLFVQ